MEYADFELVASTVEILKADGGRRVRFALSVPRSPAGSLPEPVIVEYDARELTALLRDWESRDIDWAGVIQVGYWLGNVLFPPALRDLLLQSLDHVHGQEGLRLRLLLGDELPNVPWEYALVNRVGGEATPGDFLALTPNVSVVREQGGALPEWSISATRPTQVVVALASPAGLPPLKLDQERAAIEEALAQNPQVQATFVDDATRETLLGKARAAHLFHFAGHGDFRVRPGAQPGAEEGGGVILLDDGYGDPQLLGAADLALQLRQAGVRAAVLGACRSGRRDGVNAWSSVATALLKAGLGAVVGMQYAIRDTSAIAFAGAFYRALAAGLPIDDAVTSGRLAIARTGDVRGWGVPVLYLCAKDGVIFPEYAADVALAPERAQARVEVEQAIEVLRGKAVGVEVKEIKAGIAAVRQKVGIVEKGAELTGVKAETMTGGQVKVETEAEQVVGDMTGVKIDRLG